MGGLPLQAAAGDSDGAGRHRHRGLGNGERPWALPVAVAERVAACAAGLHEHAGTDGAAALRRDAAAWRRDPGLERRARLASADPRGAARYRLSGRAHAADRPGVARRASHRVRATFLGWRAILDGRRTYGRIARGSLLAR